MTVEVYVFKNNGITHLHRVQFYFWLHETKSVYKKIVTNVVKFTSSHHIYNVGTWFARKTAVNLIWV